MKLLPRLSVSILLLASLPALAQSSIASANDDATTAIQSVVESFRTAIIQRDRPRFLSLFLHDRVIWQNVKADATLQRVREKVPTAAKVNIDPDNGPARFIDGIVNAEATSEETFDNIDIRTDGEIASVTFDYRFLSDGRETNHGQEAWQLVRTPEGWKIVSVIWSVHLQPREG